MGLGLGLGLGLGFGVGVGLPEPTHILPFQLEPVTHLALSVKNPKSNPGTNVDLAYRSVLP